MADPTDNLHMHVTERTGVAGVHSHDRKIPCSQCDWGHELNATPATPEKGDFEAFWKHLAEWRARQLRAEREENARLWEALTVILNIMVDAPAEGHDIYDVARIAKAKAEELLAVLRENP